MSFNLIRLVLVNSFLLATLSFSSTIATAQNSKTVQGRLQDSVSINLPNVNIFLINKRDTVSTISDKDGYFKISNLKIDSFDLIFRAVGFQTRILNYKIRSTNPFIDLGIIVLKQSLMHLSEVVVKGIRNPIIIKKDTVQYDATFFKRNRDITASDLLKKLPGFIVNNNGELSVNGIKLYKLRINGKEFFSGDIKEYISQLPADIISKIEIVSNSGDKSPYAINQNEPTDKILNLEIKKGKDHGIFGYIQSAGNTIKQIQFLESGNYWKGDRQIGEKATLTIANNTTGVTNTNRGELNYNDRLSKKINLRTLYNFFHNTLASQNQTISENDNTLGKITTRSDEKSFNKNTGHSFNGFISYSPNNNTTFSSNTLSNFNDNENESISTQTGLNSQIVTNNSYIKTFASNISQSFFLAHQFKKQGRTINASVKFARSVNVSSQKLLNSLTYFDTQSISKDSTLNRVIKKDFSTTQIALDLNYVEPIFKKITIDAIYSLDKAADKNNIDYDSDVDNFLMKKNALSAKYSALTLRQAITGNIHFNTQKFFSSVGVSCQPTTLKQLYSDDGNNITNTVINYAPITNINFIPNTTSSYSFIYSGLTKVPNYIQLQPIRDISNLQNTFIGNPNLKTSFTHTFSLRQTRVLKAVGTFSLENNFTFTKNDIAISTLLIKDTTGYLTQATSYKNTDGSFQIASNYTLSFPFLKIGEEKLNLDFNGNINFSRSAFFINEIKTFNKNFTINQSVGTHISFDKISGDISSAYSFSNNLYVLSNQTNSSLQTYRFICNGEWSIAPKLTCTFSFDKSINKGYDSAFTNNPFLINMGLSKQLFEKFNLELSVADILNQGSYFSRLIQGNIIIDAHSQVATRYVSLSLKMNIRNFQNN